MGICEIIEKKRDGVELSKDEIGSFVSGCVSGTIPDYQASALLMAICVRGMGFRETLGLTEAMASSGARLDLSDIPGRKVDKHSTGGVGDKVSIILAPLVASCGLVVPMVSGRGLAHTGGTLDKLESIPGFRTNLSLTQFKANLRDIGVSIISQTEELVPADRKLYALRDVTGTVASIPLIAASIMSKKASEGTDSLVLDIKVGRGGFMKRADQARELGHLMTRIGREMGLTVVALLTSAEQPLGKAVGNSLEVQEAISVLRGESASEDLLEVTLELSSHMLLLGGRAHDLGEARNLVRSTLQSGRGLSKLRELIGRQGGDSSVVENPERLGRPEFQMEVTSRETGYVAQVDALEIGLASNQLGAGRETIDQEVDRSVGIFLAKKVGEEVSRGERLATIYANSQAKGEEAKERVYRAFKIAKEKAKPPTMVIGILRAG